MVRGLGPDDDGELVGSLRIPDILHGSRNTVVAAAGANEAVELRECSHIYPIHLGRLSREAAAVHVELSVSGHDVEAQGCHATSKSGVELVARHEMIVRKGHGRGAVQLGRGKRERLARGRILVVLLVDTIVSRAARLIHGERSNG